MMQKSEECNQIIKSQLHNRRTSGFYMYIFTQSLYQGNNLMMSKSVYFGFVTFKVILFSKNDTFVPNKTRVH